VTDNIAIMQTKFSGSALTWEQRIRHRLFSAISWRLEAWAESRTMERAQQMRNRFGYLLYRAGAHKSLPHTTDRAAILCFHGIGPVDKDPEVEKDLLDIYSFRMILRTLERSFNVISLAELVAVLHKKHPPPPKCVVITFDDGLANTYELAAPELGARRMPWSVFLPANLIETGAWQWAENLQLLLLRGSRQKLSFHLGSKNLQYDLTTPQLRQKALDEIVQHCCYMLDSTRQEVFDEIYAQYSNDELEALHQRYPSFKKMSWQQISELKSAGVDIGNHSLNHVALALYSPERIREEIVEARELIERRIGNISPHFSYPYGSPASYSNTTEDILTKAGYQCALTTENALVKCPMDNLMRLPRLRIFPQAGRVLHNLWRLFNG